MNSPSGHAKPNGGRHPGRADLLRVHRRAAAGRGRAAGRAPRHQPLVSCTIVPAIGSRDQFLDPDSSGGRPHALTLTHNWTGPSPASNWTGPSPASATSIDTSFCSATPATRARGCMARVGGALQRPRFDGLSLRTGGARRRSVPPSVWSSTGPGGGPPPCRRRGS